MTPNIPRFKTNNRAQAYTLEAVIAVLLLFSVILFIAPSFATPGAQANLDRAQENQEIRQSVAAMLERNVANGELKAAILNYNTGSDDKWLNSANPKGSHYFLAENIPSALGTDIGRINAEYNVTLSIFLIPESTASQPDNPDRIKFLDRPGGVNNVGSESVTITLYDQDRTNSRAAVHTRHGTAFKQSTGDGDTLENANNYAVPEAAGTSTPETVYNVVTVRVIIDRNEL